MRGLRDGRERPRGTGLDEDATAIGKICGHRAARIDTATRPVHVHQPDHDVLHLIRQVMNDKRAALAVQLKAEASGMPETREVVVE